MAEIKDRIWNEHRFYYAARFDFKHLLIANFKDGV